MIDEYSLFINDEKRLLSEDDKKENTHRLQLFKIVDKKQHSVLSFSFVNKFYGCNEVIQKINYWLKGGYLKDKKSFPDSKVKKIMESVKQ
ncbi:hypothetical protein KKG81_12975 [bacterium]|nr:hypothetical protein [bacterium]